MSLPDTSPNVTATNSFPTFPLDGDYTSASLSCVGTLTPRPADSGATPDFYSMHSTEHNKLLYHKNSGKLKTKAPNAFMLFRLSVVKSLKGTNRSANEINSNISGQWNDMSPHERQRYKTVSRRIQSQLDLMNSRVPQRTRHAEQIQITVPDLFHNSVNTCVVSSRVSEHNSDSVIVLCDNTLSLNSVSIRPASIAHLPESERTLGIEEVQHLYHLAGLKMPDPETQSQEIAQVLTDINQLRDFLSHLRVVSESEDLSPVEPLSRISEPIVFSVDTPDGGLQAETDRATHLGSKALEAAAQTSGPYFIVEE
ncbi:hypothetical protein GGI20_004285 [Coemansia sp. BCRC 34301]|nr:hypothetical protein GGI20_004285 [Coemansia sp. BCRC 34301]